MAKKGNNIYKRKDNRWEGRYIKGYAASGNVQYGYVYGKSYREAREKQLQAQAALQNGRPAASQSNRRFDAYCEGWLTLNRSRVKRSTYVKYHNIIHNHILPHLGRKQPQQLSAAVVEEFSYRLLTAGSLRCGKGLSPKTVKDILVVLHAILDYTSRQMGGGFPTVEIVYPKEVKQEMRVLTREEQERFVRYLLSGVDCCKFGVLLALLTGMRIGEVCALRWGDISLKDRTIRVGSTMQRLQILDPSAAGKTEVVVGEPKSETSKRLIPLTDYAAELCGRMSAPGPAAFVLTGQAGRFMEPRTMQYRLAGYTKACGLENVNFHALRHTFATRCVEVDFEIKSLSEILGHSTVKVTLDRYVHSSIELKRENMQKLPAIGF